MCVSVVVKTIAKVELSCFLKKKNHVTVLHFEFTFVSCRLSDAEGSMKFSPEKKGKVSMGDFDSKVRHIKLFTYLKIHRPFDKNDKSYLRNERNYTSHV